MTKNLKHIFVVFIFNCFGLSAQINFVQFSESTLKVTLDKTGKNRFFKLVNVGNYGLMPLFSKNQFKNYIISYPKRSKGTDTAFVELSSNSTNNKFLIEKYFLLVFNYKSKQPTVYIIKEGSIDFLEAKPIIYKNNRSTKIELKTLKGKVEYLIDLDETTNSFSQILPIIDTINCVKMQYWLPTILNNLKYGVLESEKKSFLLGLYDVNNNGLFTDKNIDILTISDVKEAPYFETYQTPSTTFILDSINIKTDSTIFKIIYINPLGSSIYLEKIKNKKCDDCLSLFKEIPNQSYINTDSTAIELQSLLQRGKYLYVDIWATFCPPCVKNLPIIEDLAIKYKDKLIVLSLLDRTNLQELKRYIEKFKLRTLQGLSTDKLNYSLHQAGYPYGILFDENGKVVIQELRDLKVLSDILSKDGK